jgi:lipoprotein-anchoring transpeptidase ErfK/SrfK
MADKSSKEKFKELQRQQEELKRMQNPGAQNETGKKNRKPNFVKDNFTKTNSTKNNNTKNNNTKNSIPQNKIPKNSIPKNNIPQKAPEENDFTKEPMGNGTKLVIGAAGILLAAAVGFYGWKTWYYSDKFFNGTTINHVKCDNMTVGEVEELIRQQVENYKLQIEFRDDVTEEIDGSAIDYKYVSDDGIEKIMKKQNPFLWIQGMFKTKEYNIEASISFDKEKLDAAVSNLNSTQESAQKAPEDAYVTFQGAEFVIVDEVYGTQLDMDSFTKAVTQAVAEKSNTLVAEDAKAYVMPQVTRDSEKIVSELEQLNNLAKVSVTYQLPGGEEVLDGNTLREWLDVDEAGNYTKDDDKFKEKIEEFVENMADEVDTAGKERPFHTTSGLDVTVKGGDYGWKIDQDEEIKTLTANIDNKDAVQREPEYSKKELYNENNGLGKTYIEINLTEQHLYYYKDGEIVVDTPFVSGKMTKDRYTPEGVYFLTYKTTDRVLKGALTAEGVPSYTAHVNFWMPFNGGVGLHDASWRSKYGGTIYKYGGSHGCINLPYNKAKAIYDLIDKETPIVCVYNDGYSFIN